MKASSAQALAAAFVFGWVAFCAPTLAAEEPPAPALPLGVEQWIQPKDGGAKMWQDLHGKVVVLEFWATWCAPCVEVIPHLNELAKKFESRGVQFISINDEEAAVIEEFLPEKPIVGWVGLDTDRSMFNGYGIEGVPHTVLVGADGVLLAATNPQAVTEPILEEILAGKVDEARTKLPKPLTPTDWLAGLRSPDAPGPLYEVLIRPHQDSGVVGIKWSQSQYIARGFTVKDAIENAYDVSLARAVIPEGSAATPTTFSSLFHERTAILCAALSSKRWRSPLGCACGGRRATRMSLCSWRPRGGPRFAGGRR